MPQRNARPNGLETPGHAAVGERSRRRLLAALVMVAASVGASHSATAWQADTPATRDAAVDGPAATTQPTMPSLIQTLPDYSGSWLNSEYLTGDWGGLRTQMAEQGILFDTEITQWLQGNAHGGKDTNNAFRYSGSADYRLRLDSARMGLWPGGLLTLHGETQIGQTVNGKVGALGAPNYQGLFPVPGESGLTTLSEFYLAQALSEKFVLLAGKIDLTLGDGNVFAHDQRTQFSNAALRINPVLFNAAPYTAMAVGAVWLPADWLTVTTFVNDNDPDGAATTTGFNTAFHDRSWLTIAQQYEFKWKPFGQTGHQRFGWFWTSRDFTDLETDPRVQLPVNRVGNGFVSRRLLPRWLRVLQLGRRAYSIAQREPRPDDWGLYYNFDQFIYTDKDDPKQGWGVFGRFGWTTGKSNVFEQFYSLGLGGIGLIPCRERDGWGVGYYCSNVSDSLADLIDISSEQGIELYYNIQVTPALRVTPDLQIIIDPGAGFQDRDPAIVYGIRTQINL